jgi:hypothetical protein
MGENVFCQYHLKTKENPHGTDCSAHLAEGQCFECPYELKNAFLENNQVYISYSGKRDGTVCTDVRLAPGLEEKLRKEPENQKHL